MTTTEPIDTSAHLGGLPAMTGDTDSLPSHAEQARTLLGPAGHATLTTVTDDGYPYGSLCAYSVDVDGAVWICISEIAAHTHNLRANPAGGLFVGAAVNADEADPMNRPRLSLIGDWEPSDVPAAARQHHLDQHPPAHDYVDLPDFSFWRLRAERARFIGGFGTMSWFSVADLAAARLDEVASGSAHAVQHMNADHAESNLAIARTRGGATTASAAAMTGIDRFGVTLAATTPAGPQMVRVAFPEPLGSADQIRSAVVELARECTAAATSATSEEPS